MSVGRNLLLGLINSAWSALIALAMVPLYLRYLGVEAYGLIGFFATTLALFQMLDMGMASTINREVARCSADGELSKAGDLLHTLAAVYWVIALIIAVLVFLFAKYLAENWLRSDNLSIATIAQSVILIGVVIACRWPIGLYQGALVGAQQLAVSSLINMSMITLASIGSVIVIVFLSPTVQAFFIWQAFVGLVHSLVVRFYAWKIIGRRRKIRFNFQKLKEVWRFTAGVGFITLMGVVFTQLDKLILSKLIGLESFSHYMLASIVSGALYLIVAPVYNMAFSRFSAIVVAASSAVVLSSLRFYTRALAVVLLPIAMMIAVLSQEIIELWTGDKMLGESVGPIVSLLVSGAALNGVMSIPHALQLALGMTRVPLIVNGVLMSVIVPLIVLLSIKFGAVGGAAAWLTFNVLYVFLSAWLMHRKILDFGVGEWLFKDIILPVSLVVGVGIISSLFYRQIDLISASKMMLAAVQLILMFALGVLWTPGLYAAIKGTVYGVFRDARKY